MNEAHTFIVWQSGFNRLSRILWELSQLFDIKYAEKIIWNKKDIPKNLTKVYPNRDFDEDSPKVKEIGGNELFFILAVDKNPEIKDGVNIKAVDYKQLHRTQKKKKFLNPNLNYLHGSDNTKEAFHNYQALTGKNMNAFNNLLKKETVIYIRKKRISDIELLYVPKKQFRNVFDVFDILNKYIKYVVLRNWELLSEKPTSETHGDIDILTEDYYDTLSLLDAKPITKKSFRVNHFVKVGKQFIPFDIRFVGDNYYDRKWEELMLKKRKFEKFFYRLDDIDHFWSLLYHAIFQKKKIAEDYQEKLNLLGKRIDGFSSKIVQNPQRAKRFLRKHLRKNKIKIVKPTDKSVYFSARMSDTFRLSFGYILRNIRRITRNLFYNKVF